MEPRHNEKLQNGRSGRLITYSCFLLRCLARVVFKMQWENFNVFLTDLKAVEMHQMQGNIF